MDPEVLAACGAALERADDDVVALHESAELLPALLAELVLALRGQAKGRSSPDHAASRWADAVACGWGLDKPVSAADLLAWCAQLRTPLRDEVLTACDALAGGDADARRLGMALASASGRPLAGGLVIVRHPTRAGARWSVQDLRDL